MPEGRRPCSGFELQGQGIKELSDGALSVLDGKQVSARASVGAISRPARLSQLQSLMRVLILTALFLETQAQDDADPAPEG